MRCGAVDGEITIVSKRANVTETSSVTAIITTEQQYHFLADMPFLPQSFQPTVPRAMAVKTIKIWVANCMQARILRVFERGWLNNSTG